jgi:hypothetical protein
LDATVKLGDKVKKLAMYEAPAVAQQVESRAMWPIFGPLAGIAKWGLEKAYDSFQTSHEIRIEMVPGLLGYPDGSRVPFILVTVRNRGGTPQKIEDIALRLSNGQYILQPIGHPALTRGEAIVMATEPYETGFDLDDVKGKIAEEAAHAGRRVGVVGARARLTSGRTVRLRKKIDVNNQAPFELRKKSGGDRDFPG